MTAARTARPIKQLHAAMRKHFGPLDWWPSEAGAETPAGKLEICVGAILTQNTAWGNVEKALANLRAAGCLSVMALAGLNRRTLAPLIRPAGYFNLKAKRMGNFISAVVDQADGDIAAFLNRPMDELREALLGINGVGPETADSMMLYAAGLPTFVIDAYTLRIFRRHGLLDESDDYASAKAMFEAALPRDADLYNDTHAQIVATGKTFCRRRARCEGCPLERFPHNAAAG